jgi:predicted Zn-dependent protease
VTEAPFCEGHLVLSHRRPSSKSCSFEFSACEGALFDRTSVVMDRLERQQLEAQADRSFRRGELSSALQILRALAQAFPTDQTLRARVTEIESALQPAELLSTKSNFQTERAAPSDTERAEQQASLGDYAGAVATYRHILAKQPGNELVRERLLELYRLATQKEPPRSRTDVLSEMLLRIQERRRALEPVERKR